MASSQEHDDMVAEFVGMTGVPPSQAQGHLESSAWDLASAVTDFYNPPEEGEGDNAPPDVAPALSAASSSSTHTPPVANTARAATASTSAAPARRAYQPPRKITTLGDLASSGGPGDSRSQGGHHSRDSDSDNDADPNLYAGGEKSGLAVENPGDLKRKIIERAKRNIQRPGGDDPRQPPSHFSGTARTLGGDDTPSETIPSSMSGNDTRGPAERVTRRLHFWSNGFSIDDGPLYRLDDPRNAEILAHIKQGRAPMHLLNVSQDQEVDVQLEQHEESYRPPPKKYIPFDGKGQRLGSIAPDCSSAVPEETPSTSASASTSTSGTGIQVDESKPIVTLQIRLADGTRLTSRFNTTHTVSDVYGFVQAAQPASPAARPWTLMTTFPSRELDGREVALGDLPEFKRGGVVVQKWI